MAVAMAVAMPALSTQNQQRQAIAGSSVATRAVSAGTAKSHISVLLTGLEERGWLRRENDPSDARAKRLYLEPAGERMAERTAAVQARVVAAMTEGAPADDLSFVQRVMTVVSTRLQAELAAGP